MAAIKFPNDQEVLISSNENADIDEYYNLRQISPRKAIFTRSPILSLIVVGSSDVGKKAILDRYYKGDFPRPKPMYDPHREPLYHLTSTVNNRRCLVYWELISPGIDDQQFAQLAPKSHALLLMYDVSNRESFDCLTDCYNRFKAEVSNSLTTDLDVYGNQPIFVVANKIDLVFGEWSVHKQEGQDFATRIGARFLETSVKDEIGVSETVQNVITFGLVHCARLSLPSLRVAVAVQNKEDTEAAKWANRQQYPFAHLLFGRTPDQLESAGTMSNNSGGWTTLRNRWKRFSKHESS